MGKVVRPRPAILRALGDREPPASVEIEGQRYKRVDVLKHDSWAATAVFRDAAGRQIVCKFHRQQPIFGLPMAWLGRSLARRESHFLRELAGLKGVPKLLGPVQTDEGQVAFALAREYIPGHPLGQKEAVANDFFPRLARLLAELHVKDVAYVDLHKRENVLVGNDGQPYLIDFQVSYHARTRLPVVARLARYVLGALQVTDEFHLAKLHARCRPDQVQARRGASDLTPPWWIKLHRLIAVPFRTFRRRLLVLLNVRSGSGMASSEHFAEDAFRGIS